MTSDVVIDITRLLGLYFEGKLPTGVDRVSLAYIGHYRYRARALVRWRAMSGLFSKSTSLAVFAALQNWNFSQFSQNRVLVAVGVMSCIWRGNAKGAVLLHTGHNDAESEAFWRNVRWHNLRPVFFVHDLIPITHPQYCRTGEPERHAQRLDRMLDGAAVIANSQSTLEQLKLYAQSKGRVIPPSSVALLAVGAQFASSCVQNSSISAEENSIAPPLIDLASPYFVVLGTVEPRKNHSLLLRVWQAWGPDAAQLVVIGQPGWDNEPVIAQLQDSKAQNSRVTWIKNAKDELMKRVLADAQALLFPSYVEGFGIPMAEALALGTPVIANNLKVYREFAGNVPDYLGLEDDKSWLQAVQNYAAIDSPLRRAQIERLKLHRLPTWQQHFEKVDGLLHSLSLAGKSATAVRLQNCQKNLEIPAQRLEGFSFRKKLILQKYLRAMGIAEAKLEFSWGVKKDAPLGCVGVEDGFIRSVGLGADLVHPISWVFDTKGMYFDATQPSDIELILLQADYSVEQLQRAANLRNTLITAGVTKYNLSSPAWKRPIGLQKKRVVLVAGQVESDASIRLGAHAVRTNLELLQAARARCPNEYIVYKPHPDVVAGLRAGGQKNLALLHSQNICADEVLVHADMAQLLNEVDEVHVITSLTGFEALLRGVNVVTYGAPFYAGWGLTEDVALPNAVRDRRNRKVNLDELVAAVLIDYPLYIDPDLDILISPEQALAVLRKQRLITEHKSSQLKNWRRKYLFLWTKLRGRY